MTDKPKESSKNIGKWIVIIAILIFIGIFAFEGYKQGWLNQNTLTTINGYIQNSNFWLNWVLIAGALFILGYYTPPFKTTLQNESGNKSPYFLIAVITAISLFASIKLGTNLIYEQTFIKWLLPIDGSGNFNWKPLTNVGILWGFFCFVLPLIPIPHFSDQLAKIFKPKDERLSAAPYVIFLILSLVLANQLGAAGLWEKQQFLDAEHFFLGERAAGGSLFDTHTGIYQTAATSTAPAETRYGIFKTKVAGPDGDVFPLGVLGVVLAGLYILSLKFKELDTLGGWKFIVFFFVAASAANRGVSLQGIIAIAYFAIVLFTKKFIGDQVADWDPGTLKKYIPWIGAIIVAEYASEMVNPLTSPPYLGGGIVGKTIILSIIIIFWNFISNIYNNAAKAGLRFGVCQNCGKPCKRDSGAYLCDTPGCPANNCKEETGIDAISASIGLRIGAAFNRWIRGMGGRNRDERRDLDAADAAAGGGGAGEGADPDATRRAMLEARRAEIEEMFENERRTGVIIRPPARRAALEEELRDIRAELAIVVGAP